MPYLVRFVGVQPKRKGYDHFKIVECSPTAGVTNSHHWVAAGQSISLLYIAFMAVRAATENVQES